MRALFLLLGAAACSASAPAHAPPTAPAAVAKPAALADTCPLDLDGASLEVKDHTLGVALEFTSYGDVAELRRRVRLLADVQHADANHRFVENVDGGARIVFPAELKPQILTIAQQMNDGACAVALPGKQDERVVTR